MPTVQMLPTKQKKHQSNIFATLKNKKELTVTPSTFRFKKFQNTKLGIINPEQNSAQEAKDKKKQNELTAPPSFTTYRPGDQHFMEVIGTPCPTTNVIPNVVYTEHDKPQLPDHLVQPFFYINKLFPKGRTPEETALQHPDVFIYFQELKNSFRNNLNLYNSDYIKILKSMTADERSQFYKRSLLVNQQYFAIFKRFVNGLKSTGLLQHQNFTWGVKFPTKKIYALVREKIKPAEKYSPPEPGTNEIRFYDQYMNPDHKEELNRPDTSFRYNQNEYIFPKKNVDQFEIRGKKVQNNQHHRKFLDVKNLHDQIPLYLNQFQEFLSLMNYSKEFIEPDSKLLFDNVIVGESPVSFLQSYNQQIQAGFEKISLKAFLFNVRKYLKDKWKVKNLFSKNAAKQRNVYIRYSLFPFLKSCWRSMKSIFGMLQKCQIRALEQLEELGYGKAKQLFQQIISEINDLKTQKRILAKNMLKTPLEYLLAEFENISGTYKDSITTALSNLKNVEEFLEQLYNEKEQVQKKLVSSQFFQQNSSIKSFQVNEFTLDEAADFMIFALYDKDKASSIIKLLKRVLKYYGYRDFENKTIYAVVSQIDPQTFLTRQQVIEFISMYTEKKRFEWLEFKQFLNQVHAYVGNICQPSKLEKVLSAWKWNMLAEWIVRYLRKIDKKLTFRLTQLVAVVKGVLSKQFSNEDEVIQMMELGDHRLNFTHLMEENFYSLLSKLLNTTEDKQAEVPPPWDSDIMQAIDDYRRVATQLQSLLKQKEGQYDIPKSVSAADFVDGKEPPTYQPESYVKSNQNQQFPVEQQREKQPYTQILPDKNYQPVASDTPQHSAFPQKQLRDQVPVTSNFSQKTDISDYELDQKIKNALALQNKIFSTIDNINSSVSSLYT